MRGTATGNSATSLYGSEEDRRRRMTHGRGAGCRAIASLPLQTSVILVLHFSILTPIDEAKVLFGAIVLHSELLLFMRFRLSHVCACIRTSRGRSMGRQVDDPTMSTPAGLSI
jgi:hypothetical protein